MYCVVLYFTVSYSRSNNSHRSKTTFGRHRDTRDTTARDKDRSRTNSRNMSRRKQQHRLSHHRSSDDEDGDNSEDFFTGESDEEFVSISSNSDKAPRVSWTCEHCTYVNNPGVKVGSTLDCVLYCIVLYFIILY